MNDGIELTGVNLGRRGKAWLFQADYWDEPEFVPVGHTEWRPEAGAEEEGRGVMYIAAWLAKKNGWREE